MDPVTISALASFVLPMIGQAIGYALSQGDRERANQLADQAQREFGISPPQLQQLVEAGQIKSSEQDQGAISAQRGALADLQRYAQQGPNNIEYRAAVEQASQDAARAGQARDAGIQAQLRARGLGGSPAEMALRTMAGQGASERASQGAYAAAAEGSRRALQATQAAGGLAGQMRSAADAIAEFNARNRMGALQEDFSNRMNLAQGRANIGMQRAGQLMGQAQNTVQTGANVGSGAGHAAGTYGQYLNNQSKPPPPAQTYGGQPENPDDWYATSPYGGQ